MSQERHTSATFQVHGSTTAERPAVILATSQNIKQRLTLEYAREGYMSVA